MVVLVAFFIWETNVVAGRVRQVAILYSNDCTGIAWADPALAVLDEWSSYRGDRLNIFDCNASI